MRTLSALLALCTLVLAGRVHAEEVHATAQREAAPPCSEPADVEQVYPRVDLNQAGEAQLLDLPGIGATRARAILAYRATHGGFRNLSQLLQVKGIGRSLLKRLRPLVTL
jgi:competence protein ComEA